MPLPLLEFAFSTQIPRVEWQPARRQIRVPGLPNIFFCGIKPKNYNNNKNNFFFINNLITLIISANIIIILFMCCWW